MGAVISEARVAVGMGVKEGKLSVSFPRSDPPVTLREDKRGRRWKNQGTR